MIAQLLVRGMLAGALAGLLAFATASILGEPEVNFAIALEKQTAAVEPVTSHEHEAEDLVSRAVQASVGLLTGVGVYGIALGGLFALAFAFAYGRVGRTGPRATAALLALAGFVSVTLVPMLKYPANPPAVGNPDTLVERTLLYFAMMVVSVAAVVLAAQVRPRLVARFGAWNGNLFAALVFVAIAVAAQLVLPAINEVGEGFRGDVLWRFRVAVLAVQGVLWATIGLTFGALAERAMGSEYRFAAPTLL